VATAIVCNAIAINLKLNNSFTIHKLVMASLFHDIALQNEDLSSLISMQGKQCNSLSIQEKNLFAKHIYDSIQTLRSFPDVPPNVESIILEHHERPNGLGFPSGLDSFRVSPLACILIIAEEFVDHVFRHGFNEDSRNEALEKMSKEFCKGNFKEPMNALLKIYIQG